MELEIVNERIRTRRKILTLCPPGHAKRARSLTKLADDLEIRFDQSGQSEDLEEAISHHRDALSLRPPSHPDRSISLTNVAFSLKTRFRWFGRIVDLEDAITFYREALNLCPPGDPDRPLSLSNLANSLQIRFEQVGQMKDLEDAILYHHDALALYPPRHQFRTESLSDLASALLTRFEQLGDIKDLDDAIVFHRDAVTLRPPGHPDRSVSLSNLAIALGSRFELLGRIEDLEDAISFHRDAFSQRPPGHADRSMSLNNLGNALRIRFEQLGRIDDLEDAILFHREALTLRPPGHQFRTSSLTNIAVSLQTRFQQLGRIEDLEDAIAFYHNALALYSSGHQFRANALSNLAEALRNRFEQLDQIDDLESAISLHRDALALHPPGHQDRSMSVNNLASTLRIRFEQLGRVEDLEEAISFYRDSIILRPPGHPDRFSSLTNLGNALVNRFKRFGRVEDLEDAISFHHEAVALCPTGHPCRSNSLNNLANCLLIRVEKSGRIEDLRKSFTLYEQATNNLSSTSYDRLCAALDWATNAQRHHDRSITSAYSVLFRLLDRCLMLQSTVQLQHKFLANIPKSLASDAASAAIGVGELGLAVELLEQGRAILWSKIEGYRRPLDQLRQVNRELSNHLEGLSLRLERLALSSNPGSLDHYSSEAQIKNHRILAGEWETVVERVRQVEGFGNFLQPVPFATLRMAAAEGPVVLINISKYRSDAVILHAESPPSLITLPDVQPQEFTQLTRQLIFARNSGFDANSSKYFIPILRNMWDNIVSPVVDRLTKLGVQEKSRIWWCPTSELCALPLHAAGPYRRGQKNLSDMYIFSYIPTLSALIRARSNPTSQAAVPKLVVIGQPAEDLPKIQEEIDIIQQLGGCVDAVISARASRQIVLRLLQQHSWAHFACHGHLGGKDQPFLASFQLHGGIRLTLLDLIQARLPNAELAFLSACHSAASDLITPDETIHLAAALQFCGFRSVVGTLWEMNDEDGPIISKEFYRHMFREPGKKADFRDSAEALNLAIRSMRKNGVPLHRWIMFVHIGA